MFRTAFRIMAIACVLALLHGTLDARAQTAPTTAPASGLVPISVATGQNGARATVTVWTYRPANYTPESRIVVVMHGVKRSAKAYLRAWTATADRLGLLLAAPEFSQAGWPGSRSYNLGRLHRRKGVPPSDNQTTFAAVEKTFDAMRAHFGNRTAGYFLFGHSAGAQFVHRMILFHPGNRIIGAAAANAGWYTLPDPAIAFPYGIANTSVTPAHLRHILARPFIVILGRDDIDADHEALRRTPGANAQGPNRLARGRHFFAIAKHQAKRLGVPFAWQLVELDGIAHDHAKLVPAAAAQLLHVP